MAVNDGNCVKHNRSVDENNVNCSATIKNWAWKLLEIRQKYCWYRFTGTNDVVKQTWVKFADLSDLPSNKCYVLRLSHHVLKKQQTHTVHNVYVSLNICVLLLMAIVAWVTFSATMSCGLLISPTLNPSPNVRTDQHMANVCKRDKLP